MQQHTRATYTKLAARLSSFIILCAISTLCIPTKIAAQTCIHTVTPHNIFYTDHCATPTLAAAVAAANTEGGGTVYVTTPGSYSVTSTLKLGASAGVGGGVTAVVDLVIGNGVTLSCSMTDGTNCIEINDGSSIHGNPGAVFNGRAFKDTATITCAGGSTHLSNMVTNARQDGLQQLITVNGVNLIGCGGTIDQALLHLRGLFSGTSISNAYMALIGNSIGLLIDNPSGAAIAGTATGSGTTVTATESASTTATPDAHHVWSGGQVTVTGCSNTAFNGTSLPVIALLNNTQFQYTAGAVSGSATGCSFAPVLHGSAITSVVHLANIVSNGSHQTGARPMVFSTVSPGAVGDIWCYTCDPEGAAFGGIDLEINGNGGATGMDNIGFLGMHIEPGGGDTTGTNVGMKIRDAQNLNVFSVSGGGANGTAGETLFDISQSGSNRTYNINIQGIVAQGWPNVVNNHILSSITAATNSGGNATLSLREYHYAGTNWDGTPAGAVVSQ